MGRESREVWAKRVERWRDSGLSVKEFARELGVNHNTLAGWRYSLGVEELARATSKHAGESAPRNGARAEEASIAQHEILSRRTIDLMLSPQIAIDSKHEFPTLNYERTDANKAIRLSYGLGWGLYITPVGKAWFKEGHTDGFRNYSVMFDNGTGIVIMTNSSNGEGIYKDLLETLIANRWTPLEWEGFTPYDKLPPLPLLKQH